VPLKRTTPTFTVEYRQNKRRLSLGDARWNAAEANLAPTKSDKASDRLAISAFKPAPTESQAEIILQTIPARRILPSLVEKGPEADGSRHRKRKHEGLSRKRLWLQNGSEQSNNEDTLGVERAAELTNQSTTRAPSSATETTGSLPPSEDAARTIVRWLTTDASRSLGASSRPKSKKRASESKSSSKNLRAVRSDDEGFDTTFDKLPSAPPATADAAPTIRKGRIFGRYVSLDQLRPEESWKRRVVRRRKHSG
jgi:hypothetical protein